MAQLEHKKFSSIRGTHTQAHTRFLFACDRISSLCSPDWPGTSLKLTVPLPSECWEKAMHMYMSLLQVCFGDSLIL